jgi:hypothetical protein
MDDILENPSSCSWYGDLIEVHGGHDPCAKLPGIAERLGVRPMDRGAPPAMVEFATRDGKRFDFFELLSAFLDRMDSATVS